MRAKRQTLKHSRTALAGRRLLQAETVGNNNLKRSLRERRRPGPLNADLNPGLGSVFTTRIRVRVNKSHHWRAQLPVARTRTARYSRTIVSTLVSHVTVQVIIRLLYPISHVETFKLASSEHT